MRKKVLLAEQSDSTRSIIETILRQNGFEVVSVSDYDRSVDVLGLSKPDIMIVGSDLVGSDDKPLYSFILDNEIYNSIPILLLASDEDSSIPYPEEVIIRRPFDTNELLDKVKIFAGQNISKGESVNVTSDLLGGLHLDDEFLDAALGLDHISVTDSEELNKTSTAIKRNIGNEKVTNIGDFDEMNDSNKVESIMIHEDQTDIRRPVTQKTKIVQPNASGKIDILQDQYGMSEQAQKALEAEDSVHDYHWFVNEMQNEAKPKPAASSNANTNTNDHQLGSIKIEETVQPLTSRHINDAVSKKSNSQGEGVEKFIDEFKREMEKIHSDKKTETVTLRDEKPQVSRSGKAASPQANEQILSEAVKLFTKQFTIALAEKLAKEIAVKIDTEKLLVLIKNEILAELKKK